ncbi:hypothetical protein [Chryseobacterium daeguense]|uniref:hypothetical protein n=1 Tax=Chryseobacterium daeguense TaxID=412438 RepID=UPI0003F77130|nr:hypothetical protein [Chryseobacterium daeguense]
MITKLRTVPKEKYWEYFILVSRFLLAFTFFNYGFGKLFVGQFGISPEEMATSIKDLSLFRVMWYLFDHEPFNSVVGILQIITAVLLLFHRTVILGVFFFIPIAANIILMDVSFMPEGLAMGFARRFTGYFILCFLILWHERERMRLIWRAMIKEFSFKLRFPVIMYLLIPVFALILEFLPGILQMIYFSITEPQKSWSFIQNAFGYIF